MNRARADRPMHCLLVGSAYVSLSLACCSRDVPLHSVQGKSSDFQATPIAIVPSSVHGPIGVRLGQRKAIIVWQEYSPGPLLIWQQNSWHTVSVPPSVDVIARAGNSGDSVWIYDAAARSVLLRNSGGRWTGQFVPTLVAGYVQSLGAILEDDRLVFVSTDRDHDAQPVRAYVWVATGPSLKVLDSLMSPPGSLSMRGQTGGFVRLEQPWRSRSFVVIASDRRAVLVMSPKVLSNDTAIVEVARYEGPRFHPTRYAIHLPLWHLPERDVRQWKTEMLTDSLTSQLGGTLAASLQLDRNVYRPIYLPPVTAAAELDDSTLLFERPVPGGSRIWQLYSANGELVAETVPRVNWRLLDARNGEVLFGSTGPLGKIDTMFVGRYRRTH